MSAGSPSKLHRIGAAVDDPAFALAEEAFYRAESDSCKAFLDLCRPGNAPDRAKLAILRSRLARSEEDVATWISAASGARDERQAPVALRAMAVALLGSGFRYARRAAEADAAFATLPEMLRDATPLQAAYPRYLIALDVWQSGDYPRAQALARENVALYPDDSESTALVGWIAIKNERFADAIVGFRDSLTIANRIEPDAVRHRGVVIHQILNLAMETADLELCALMRREFEAIVWTSTMRFMQFASMMALYYAAILRGNLEEAWFHVRSAIAIAPSLPYEVHSEICSAVVTKRLGDTVTSAMQFNRAWEAIRDYKWGTSDVAQRVALTEFAAEAAPSMPGEARKALMMYASVQGREIGTESLTHDRRIAATELGAAGRVAEAIGDRAEARAYYDRALKIWIELGYSMRAADTALDLLRLTGEAVYREPIATLEKRAPNAWSVRTARHIV